MNRSLILAWIIALLGAGSPSWGANNVNGRMTADGVTGKTAVGRGWAEEHLYLVSQSGSVAATDITDISPPGYYSVSGGFPEGEYFLLTLGFDRAPAFSYQSINLPGGAVPVGPVEFRTPAHYSVGYNQSFTEWGSEPWIWGSSFYQTFVATSNHITRLATKLAGKSGDHYALALNFAVYATNDGPPSTWPQISSTRTYQVGGNVDPIIHIFWVAYRSDEMVMTIGQTYAVRIWAAPGSQATSFAVVARPDVAFNGYTGGQLYVDDTPHPELDGYFYISGGTPGTVVNHAPRGNLAFNELVGWHTRFGQTFRATGTSLAGVEAAYTTGSEHPTLYNVTFQVYDAVGGNPIGPPRVGKGVGLFHQARVAVAWREDEVPLVPGQMYYLEYTVPEPGCNTWSLQESVPGELYVNRVPQAPYDLAMAIAEYRQPGPTLSVSTNELVRSMRIGGSLSPDVFTVRNSGTGTVEYTITKDVSWFTVAPDSGSSTDEQDEITVTYGDVASLPVGIHEGIITVADPDALDSPQEILVTLTIEYYPGDMDRDNDVDAEDFGLFQRCLTGPGIPQTNPACAPARLDEDDDVDLDDVEVFLSCFSGPDRTPPAGCGN